MVSFYSEGLKIEALVRRPEGPPGSRGYPVIIHGPGYLGLANSRVSRFYNEVFCKEGFAVVAPNYRGFGGSEGERGWILPDVQLQDLVNTLTYVETVADFDALRIGAYGHGGTGGGNAIMLAGVDHRIKCVAAQSPIADGATWLRSMRRNYEWLALLERVDANARTRVLEGRGEIVDPREEIMVATPQRKQEVARAAADKANTDQTVGAEFHLASIEHILRYRPIDYIRKISPRPILVISLNRDAVTPEYLGAELLFEKALAPKTLVRQNEAITHYRSYEQNLDLVGPILSDFYRQHLVDTRLSVVRSCPTGLTVEHVGEKRASGAGKEQ
jgi:alpha/beta superfamily hydrolase